jgi:hypothetical protein
VRIVLNLAFHRDFVVMVVVSLRSKCDCISMVPSIKKKKTKKKRGNEKQKLTFFFIPYRIREDTAKYLRNLDVGSAHYDPKTRSMRDNPNKEKDPREV